MSLWLWAAFGLFLLGAVAVDLRLLRPQRQEIPPIRRALAWSGLWLALAAVFAAVVFFIYRHDWLGKGAKLTGDEAAQEFLTVYLVERSLSLDNLLAMAVIFGAFGVPLAGQMRVLDHALIAAVILRTITVIGGVALIDHFAWFTYIYGAMLIITALRLLFSRPDRIDYRRLPVVRGIRKRARLTTDFEGDCFIVNRDGKRRATPLLLALVVIQWTNVVFAVNAVPASLAISVDPFLVFTANAFAVLGLRSLYFALLGTLERFRFVKVSLVAILLWVAVKTLLHGWVVMPTWLTMSVVAASLTGGVLASMLFPSTQRGPWVPPVPPELASLAEVTWNTARRAVIFVVGVTVLLVGVAMIILPGPAVVVIPLGLAILATEFVWAQRLLRRARKGVKSAVSRKPKWVRLPRFFRRTSPPPPPQG